MIVTVRNSSVILEICVHTCWTRGRDRFPSPVIAPSVTAQAASCWTAHELGQSENSPDASPKISLSLRPNDINANNEVRHLDCRQPNLYCTQCVLSQAHCRLDNSAPSYAPDCPPSVRNDFKIRHDECIHSYITVPKKFYKIRTANTAKKLPYSRHFKIFNYQVRF
jgi:hypothetical protein